jgi:hypothetical protein
MSSTLERIARVAVEKDEKRARAPDEEDQEDKPPGAKRHSSRSSHPAQHRQQRQPTTLRTTMTPDTAPQHQTSSTPTPNRLDTSIPDTLDGLPPVNSSGYMVPISPILDSTQPQPSYLPNQPSTYARTNTNPNSAYIHETTGTFPWQLSQDFSTSQSQAGSGSTLNATTINSPDSFSSSNAVPEFFQMPMAGDWDYGSNLFAGLFPTEYSFPPPHPDGPQSTDAYPSMPILSAESFIHGAPAVEGHAQSGGVDATGLGYGYMPQGQEDPNQGADPVWPNGFLGLF